MNNNKMLRKIKKSETDIVELNEQLEQNKQELTNKINEVATTGTTVETVQNKVDDMAKKGLIQAYTLGDGTVEARKIYNIITNVFDKYVEGKLYRVSGVTSIIPENDNITTDYIEVKAGDVVYSNAKITVYESADTNKAIVNYGNFSVADYKNELTVDLSQTNTKYIRLSLLKSSINSIDNIVITINKKTTNIIKKRKSQIPWLDIQQENIGFNIAENLDLTNKIKPADFYGRLEGNINKTTHTIGRLKRASGVTSIDSSITNYRTTDYLPVVDGDILYCETPYIYYETVNASNSITRYAETGVNSSFVIDNGSKYIRISFPIDKIEPSAYVISKNVNVEEGKLLNNDGTLVPWLKVGKDNILSTDYTHKYNFWANYLVVPDKLYFIKDYDYSIIADNFCNDRRVLNKDLKFEMTMPTYTELQQDTIRIKSPVAQKFLTRLNIIQEGTSAKNRAIDVELNFKDTSKIQNKTCNVMIIGDSIVNAMIPSLTKYWLENFGLSPNFIGTMANDNKEFGYGNLGAIPTANGEGRGGWRTTDFINTTKWLDGTHFDMMYSYKPFWSTTTGAFDFSYYMQQNFPSTQIDYVIIALGTNDIGNGHYSGKKNEIYSPTENELFTSGSEYYFPTMFDKIINSIKAYAPNVKIALAPPMVSGDDDDFNRKARRLASLEITYYRNVENVFVLGNYLAQGQYSGSYKSNAKTYHDTNTSLTYNFVSENDVHRNLAVAQNNALWFASWIANMMN